MIIGISGKKKCGKDTVADILCQLLPTPVKYHFAQELKNEVARATGFSIDYINSHKDNFRLILQGWGTDFRRKIYGADYWIKKVDQAIVQLSHAQTIIIPDVRFMNELEYIKDKGGIIIRVDRFIDYGDQHISETELDGAPYDHHILNNGSMEQLIEKVQKLGIK